MDATTDALRRLPPGRWNYNGRSSSGAPMSHLLSGWPKHTWRERSTIVLDPMFHVFYAVFRFLEHHPRGAKDHPRMMLQSREKATWELVSTRDLRDADEDDG